MTLLATIGLILLIFFLIGLGQPVYILLGGVATYLLVVTELYPAFLSDISPDLTIIVEVTRKLADNEVLLAIPFFIIAGAIMTEGDIAKRLINFCKAIFGPLPGGLAIAAIFACVFFAAISGSSPVTVIAIGSIMFPALVKEGYGERFSSGLVTSAGSLGILIPPSIPMIVYAIAAGQEGFREPPRGHLVPHVEAFDNALTWVADTFQFLDPVNVFSRLGVPEVLELGVTDLFLAGVGPGLVIAIILSKFAITKGIRRKVPRSPFSPRVIWRTFVDGIWALFLPILILGGIYSGAFTATQAACVAVVYSLVVELFIHRSISYRDIHKLMSESLVLIGSLLLILALAQAFSKFIEQAQVADAAVQMLLEMNVGPVEFLLFLNIILLLTGCFMDILSAILILVPLMSPIALGLGIHPLHLGVIFIVNLEIGYLTPPLGINLFVASTLFKKSLGNIIRATIPFTGLMLCALILVTYVPSVSLGLVSVFHGGSPTVAFPEPHLPMHRMETPEEMHLLASFANEYGEQEEAEEDTGRPLSLAEIMAQADAGLEEEDLSQITYESLADMLRDFRDVADEEVQIRDLLGRRQREAAEADENEPETEEP